MWKKYFKVVEIVPGPVIIQGFGEIDFSSDDITVDTCKKLFEADCRYLQITDEGKKKIYGVKKEQPQPRNTKRKRGQRKRN